MTTPLQITFRDLDPSDAISAYVRSRADKLSGAFGSNIVTCQVAIEAPHRSKQHGRHYRVRLDLAVAGAEIIVDRCPDESYACEDLYAAIDQAFDHAVRRLRRDAERRLHAHGRPRP